VKTKHTVLVVFVCQSGDLFLSNWLALSQNKLVCVCVY